MGKFSITVRNDGQYYFSLKASNGEVMLISEGYTSSVACNNAIESVRENSQRLFSYENITAQNGKFYFVLKAVNGQVIGRSQFYESELGRYNGILGVMKNGTTEIVEYDDSVKPVKQNWREDEGDNNKPVKRAQ